MEEREVKDELKLDNGKYHFYIDDEDNLRCNRYGKPWREFIGDNAVLTLFQCAMDLTK